MMTEDAAASLAQFKTSRSSIKGSQTKIKKYVEAHSAGMTEFEAASRLGLLENFFNQFESVQANIERLDSTELTKEDREKFEDTYCKIKATLLSVQAKTRRASLQGFEIQQSFNEVNASQSHIPYRRLPKLELPHFNGKYTEWHDFYKCFTTLVHEDQHLSTIEKFTHLRNCVKEPAINTIKALEMSEANYLEAIKLLRDRYENKRVIFQAHIRALHEIKPISKSAASLRNLIDLVNCNMRALISLGSHEDLHNAFLLFLVASKLDDSSLAKWEEEAANEKLPTWKDLEGCLTKRCHALESKEYNMAFNSTSSAKATSIKTSYNRSTVRTTLSANVSSDRQWYCVLCDSKEHGIARCQKFNLMTTIERFNEAKRLELCINCLQKGHRVRYCRAERCCRCNQRHHTLLHREEGQQAFQTLSNSDGKIMMKSIAPEPSKATLHSACSLNEQCSLDETIILATAVVSVRGQYGERVECRALLDSASQLNFVTDNVVQSLKLKKERADLVVSGVNNSKTRIKHKVYLNIKSRFNDFSMGLEMMVVPKITSDQPNSSVSVDQCQVPADILMADPEFHRSQKVDMLIGAEVFYELMGANRVKISKNLPAFHETKLGWIVAGKIPANNKKNAFCITLDQSTPEENRLVELEKNLERFWTIEGFESNEKVFSKEEQECEEHFMLNFSRDIDGRFTVKLPLKLEIAALGDSFWVAKTRFLNLERRLHRIPEVKQQYQAFLSEYENLQHMQRVDDNERHRCKYFLPHHCVLKPESLSTKLRVVFDASCKTTSGESLNSIMKVGPTIQKDLFSILMRFRSHRFALIADISKMYRQVRVDEEQTYLQCILWRSDPSHSLQVFRLKTITYGTAAASFLAIRCLQYLAQENVSSKPLGAKAILEDFYVDDMLSGADSVEQLEQLRREVDAILKSGGFELRKWSSNDVRVLQGIPEASLGSGIRIDSNDCVKTLGLSWHPAEDVFRYEYSPKIVNTEISKRQVLADIATVFDPLGLINPVIVAAKIFMQHLWRLNLDWDAALPEPYNSHWVKFRGQLSSVKKLIFSRFVFAPGGIKAELHGFSDASSVAYGCCIYVRCRSGGSVSCRLLCAKSRVAPIKTVSIPRLELCAAELLANLLRRVVSELTFAFDRVCCWTDSEVVLNWLAAHPANWTTFVSNRVSTIQRLTDKYAWNHVDTKNNPADLVSRGVTPEVLSQSTMWFNGPRFLHFDTEFWPVQRKSLDLGNALERRKMETVLVSSKQSDIVSSCRFINSHERLLRVFAYILRFVDFCVSARKRELDSSFTPSEILRALKFVVRVIQREFFASEYNRIREGKPISSTSQLRKLRPFMDEDNILRVGGRLEQADLPYDGRHPMLLPTSTLFVTSLFEHIHCRNLHAGPQALLAIVRQRFWVLRGRDVARKVVHRCLICFRHRPLLYQQIMGNLPAKRVQPARPFVISGVDFCGPVWVHYKHRGQRPSKAYIAVFVCFATKATHLELVTNLSADTFIGALKRFVARRGICRSLYCDNATNFVGGRRQLSECRELFLKQEVREHIIAACLKDSIEFRHIPPRSPHFGGLWEAAVKSAKHHLNRVLGDTTLTYEEMVTVITQIEAVLNSRPLTPMSSDPSDYEALTPGHFLIGEPLNAIIEPDLSELKLGRLSRLQLIRRLQQTFWNRWSKEYLAQLQCRAKWTTHSDIKLGTLVLMAEENIPPQKWNMGRIVKLHPGKDGTVRVVSVKMHQDIYKRAVHRLAPLPLNEDDVM